MNDLWLYLGFAVIVAAVLAFDLGIIGRQEHELGLRKALTMVAAYVLLALLFGAALTAIKGADTGIEYLTAYLLEQSLSIDNIFVWVLIFDYLNVPEEAQHKVLFWGIGGAILLRGAFIFVGTALIENFDWMLYVFATLVIVSAVRLLRSRGEAKHDVRQSRLLLFLQKRLRVAQHYEGRRFFVRYGAQRCATPLLLAMLMIELTDIAFALDSIPAIFGVTHNRLVVYTSNIFAVLGLRALYFAVAGLVEHLRFLRYGLALLLLLIGAKMLADPFVEIPLYATLGATVVVVGGTIALSLLRPGPRSSRQEST